MGQQVTYEEISNEINETFFEPYANSLIEERENDFSLFQKLLKLEARILNCSLDTLVVQQMPCLGNR